MESHRLNFVMFIKRSYYDKEKSENHFSVVIEYNVTKMIQNEGGCK